MTRVPSPAPAHPAGTGYHPRPADRPATEAGTLLSPKFQDALVAAVSYHARQFRKTGGAPYVSHPLQVAGIALEHGADEETAIAALLHDVLEDTEVPFAELETRFGRRVADLVLACSDTTERPKPPWRERKERYLAHLRTAEPDAALVSAADKLHNLRSMVTAWHAEGDGLWGHFQGGRDGTLWYYREIVRALRGRAPDALVDEIERTVRQLHLLAGEAGDPR